MRAKASRFGKCVAAWYARNAERIALWIVSLWCLLPVAMSAYDFYMSATGGFPSDEELHALGFSVGYINYNVAIRTYYNMFCVLGYVTLAYALLSIAFRWKRIFNWKSVRSRPWFCLFFGVLCCTVISSLLSDDFNRALTGGSYLFDGLRSYFFYGSVFVCASLLQEERHRRWALRLYCAVMGYLALIMIVQEFSNSDFLYHCFPSYRAVVFNQFNHFGYVLCMGVIAMLGLYLFDRRANAALRVIYLIGFLFLGFALVINNTFGAYLATMVVLSVIYVFCRKAGNHLSFSALLPVLAFLLLSALACIFVKSSRETLLVSFRQFANDIVNIFNGNAMSAGKGRIMLWKETLTRIGQRPFFGFGPEGFNGANALTNRDSTHNEFLQLAGFHGIPALVMYLAGLLTLACRQWRNIRRLSPLILAAAGATVAYLVSSCFGNPVFNTAPFFWMFLGMTTSEDERG